MIIYALWSKIYGNSFQLPDNVCYSPSLCYRNDIVVAVVACGNRLLETLNMLKSALMFSKVKLNFIVVAEERLIESFNEKVWNV